MKRKVKKVLIAILGGAVVLIGIAMIPLPGPAIIVIPCGLAILATEFEFAKRWLQAIRQKISALKNRRRSRSKPNPPAENAPSSIETRELS